MARVRMTVSDTPVGDIDLVVASPRGTRRHQGLPLVLAHDGPDYSRRAGIVRLLEAEAAAGDLPPVRVALLVPTDRNQRYAANPGYARALTGHVLPAVTAAYATPAKPTIVGASLGALAALQAEWLTPGTFGGLLLQSGSFFRKGIDDEEDFAHWARVTAFVTAVRRARRRRSDALVTMTCGADEGNLTNNRQLAATLARLGHDVELHVSPGGHDWNQWRSALDAHLPRLLTRVIAGCE